MSLFVHHNLVEGCPKSIFCLHGFFGSGLDFAPLWQKRPEISFVAPDFLGHGLSLCPDNINDYALNNTLRLLDEAYNKQGALRAHKPILLGYSMGGRIALHWALRHPNRFSKLVLIGASPGIKEPMLRHERMLQDTQLAESITKNGLNWFREHWSQTPIIKSQQNIPAEILKTMNSRKACQNILGLKNTLLALGTGTLPSLWDKLFELNLPTYLVAGANDKKFTGIAYHMAKLVPNSQVILVPDAGHTPHLENLPKFLEILRGFY